MPYGSPRVHVKNFFLLRKPARAFSLHINIISIVYVYSNGIPYNMLLKKAQLYTSY